VWDLFSYFFRPADTRSSRSLDNFSRLSYYELHENPSIRCVVVGLVLGGSGVVGAADDVEIRRGGASKSHFSDSLSANLIVGMVYSGSDTHVCKTVQRLAGISARDSESINRLHIELRGRTRPSEKIRGERIRSAVSGNRKDLSEKRLDYRDRIRGIDCRRCPPCDSLNHPPDTKGCGMAQVTGTTHNGRELFRGRGLIS
jgi:hypothetical protein